MPSPSIVVVVSLALVVCATLAIFLVYVFLRYSPIVARIFEDKPMFLPLRAKRPEEGEDVRFPTKGGLTLEGTYLPTRTEKRSGVLVFCHEYLSDRWSALPYLDHLRDQGFDLFTFDFRNHGVSDKDPKYNPLQWVTQHEVNDLNAAIDYLRTRPDRDPAGFGLFGVSRGGGTALCVGARDRGVWGVVTDGAFPTRGTMVAYIHRWAEIYVGNPWVWKMMPHWVFEYLGLVARIRTQLRLRCRYSNVEQAVARLAPRPWLAIHGQKDAYIGVAIAEQLWQRAGEPKELWIVAKAKHNRCREANPADYAERLEQFFTRFAPRRVQNQAVDAAVKSVENVTRFVDAPVHFGPVTVPVEVSVPLPG